jgi:hypothetical protein
MTDQEVVDAVVDAAEWQMSPPEWDYSYWNYVSPKGMLMGDPTKEDV